MDREKQYEKAVEKMARHAANVTAAMALLGAKKEYFGASLNTEAVENVLQKELGYASSAACEAEQLLSSMGILPEKPVATAASNAKTAEALSQLFSPRRKG